jgi:hypothetical protein
MMSIALMVIVPTVVVLAITIDLAVLVTWLHRAASRRMMS